MPRARLIHPEITTDSKLAKLPRDVRLFFIYALTHADDAGNFADDPDQLKAIVFPYDTDIEAFTIRQFLDMLHERSVYVRYTLGERSYYGIRNFSKWQPIDRPTAPKHPLAPGQKYRYSFRKAGKFQDTTVTEQEWNLQKYGENSKTVHRTFGECSPLVLAEGKEGKEERLNFLTPPFPSSSNRGPAETPSARVARRPGEPAAPTPPERHHQNDTHETHPNDDQIDFSDPEQYAMVKFLEDMGVNTDILESGRELRTVYESWKKKMAQDAQKPRA